jgi:hypothetical protein
MPLTRAQGAFAGNEEPSLDELLGEPIIRRLMARDRIDEASIRQLAAIIIRELREAREPGSTGN